MKTTTVYLSEVCPTLLPNYKIILKFVFKLSYLCHILRVAKVSQVTVHLY